jgi:hypothetical protein
VHKGNTHLAGSFFGLTEALAHLSHSCPALIEDQAIDIVGEISERDLRLGAGGAVVPDKHPDVILLPGEDVFGASVDRELCGPGSGCAAGISSRGGVLRRMRLTRAVRLSPAWLSLLRQGGIGPHCGRYMVANDDVAQRSPVAARALSDFAAADEPIAPTDRDAALIFEAGSISRPRDNSWKCAGGRHD